jgi:hypothetical protein
VSIGITTLLSITVFLMLVAESMPPTSEQLPLLGIYYGVTITIVSFSTAMAVITLNVNNKGYNGKRVPKLVRIIYFEYLVKIFRTELTSKNKKLNLLDNLKSKNRRKYSEANELMPLTNLIHEKKNMLIDSYRLASGDDRLADLNTSPRIKFNRRRNRFNSLANQFEMNKATVELENLVYSSYPSRRQQHQRLRLSQEIDDTDGLILEAQEPTTTTLGNLEKRASKSSPVNTISTANHIRNNENIIANKLILKPMDLVNSGPSKRSSQCSYDSSYQVNKSNAILNHNEVIRKHLTASSSASNAAPKQMRQRRDGGGAGGGTQPVMRASSLLNHNHHDRISSPIGDSGVVDNNSSPSTTTANMRFLFELERMLEKQFSPLVRRLVDTLNKNENRAIEKEMLEHIQHEWADVASISDHFLCYFFPIMTIFTCVYIFFTSPHVLEKW